MAFWRGMAEQIVKSRVQLHVCPREEAQLATEIEQSPVSKLAIVSGATNRLIHYDPKLGAEANSRPASRKAPSREIHVRTCVAAALKALGPANGSVIAPGDLYVFFDQGMPKKSSTYFGVNFKKSADDRTIAPTVLHRKVTICIDQDSILARRRSKYVAQLEGMHIFYNSEETIPDRKYKVYPGSTRGDAIVGVVLSPYSQSWRVKMAEKRQAYGDAIVRVGGPGGGDEDELEIDGQADARADASGAPEDGQVVPFAWWSFPKPFYGALLDAYGIAATIDFTPGDGNLALAVLERKSVYVGFCFTDQHCNMLLQHLVDQVFSALKTEGNPLCQAECAKVFKGTGARPNHPPKDPPPPKLPKKDKKDKKDNKKNKKSKKEKKERSPSRSSSDPPQSDESAESLI
jgi:hypothetical protein